MKGSRFSEEQIIIVRHSAIGANAWTTQRCGNDCGNWQPNVGGLDIGASAGCWRGKATS